MRRVVLHVLGALLIGLGLTSEVRAFGFRVDPARVEVEVPAGKRRGRTLRVTNTKQEGAVHLSTYVRDVLFLPDGAHEFPPPGSTDWSCADWIEVVPKEVNIPAGYTQDVRVSVRAPEGAVGGHYAMLFFETGPSYTEGHIGVNFRIGALVDVAIPDTQEYAAKLQDVAFDGPSTIRVEVFNLGNVLIRPKGVIKIFEGNGQKIHELPFNPNHVGVLPQTLRVFSTELEEPLPSGTYRLKAEVDYGTRTLIVGERSFDID